MVFSILEIALRIMLPLVVFYQRSSWSYREYLPALILIYLLWYLTYALFHLLMYLLGVWFFDKAVYETKLFPKFWPDDFGSGYVRYDYQ